MLVCRLNTKFDLEGDYDPSDSENEYGEDEQRLLTKARKGYGGDSESEEEVYGFSDSDKEQERADSDVEGQEESGDDIPDLRAWGQNKKLFHGTGFVDQDYGGYGKDEVAATFEEEEARIIQTKLVEQLDDDDFSLDFFTSKNAEDGGKKEKDSDILIKTDLSQMSKRQKIQLLEKESPEFSGLVNDFKTKLSIAKGTLLPFLKLAKEGKIPDCGAVQFVKTMYDLILNYCTNISFYLLLKVKKTNIQNHPAIKRLYQYRQMLNQIEPIYESTIQPQIETILAAIENDECIEIESKQKVKKNKSAKKLNLISKLDKKEHKKLEESNDPDDVNSEDGADSDKEQPEIAKSQNVLENGLNIEEGEGEKRAITYQMAKNKGLTPHRKKEQRNPRVKHRNKYRKAKITRKTSVREVRTELSRYAGEITGIKSNVKKSVKIR